jgi:tripartite ATP-independent transporter DctP family solute receptor
MLHSRTVDRRDNSLTRRRFLQALSGAAGVVALPAFARSRAAAAFTARQFHNQPEESALHQALVALWDGVARESRGALRVQVLANNGNVAGSDPAVLKMLVAGEVEFFTLFGAILGLEVPVAEMQALPFIFRDRRTALAATDGAFGGFLRREMLAHGIYGFPHGAFENGFRAISNSVRPIEQASDVEGLRIRTPDSQVFTELFRALGAEPKIVNFDQLYGALARHEVDGQDNPVEVTAINRFYEVQGHLSLTSHMWSCFNQLANLEYWRRLPRELQGLVQKGLKSAVDAQRRAQDRKNTGLVDVLARQGMKITRPEQASFRTRLAPEYARWRKRFGEAAWHALEASVGPVG